jgi:hypothetical protein
MKGVGLDAQAGLASDSSSRLAEMRAELQALVGSMILTSVFSSGSHLLAEQLFGGTALEMIREHFHRSG